MARKMMTPPLSKATQSSASSNRCSREPAATASDSQEGLSESELLTLVIKFGKIRMCAALTHGHSFETSIFKLPSKCSACNEMVWGPFTRACTCLTCKLTAHRACTGRKDIPPCPTKAVFESFCRSEMEKRRREAGTHRDPDHQHLVQTAVTPGERSGDLDEWATVEGSCSSAADKDKGRRDASPSSSISLPPPSREELPVAPQPIPSGQEAQDLGSSFSWSPFGIMGGRKQLKSPHSRCGKPPGSSTRSESTGEEQTLLGDSTADSSPAAEQPPSPTKASPTEKAEATQDSTVSARSVSSGAPSSGVSGFTSFSRISVAGGVVGAVIAGPAGAVAGLKLGVVVAAGRWTVQEALWQRIKQDRKEAGADIAGSLGKALPAGDSRSLAGESSHEGGGAEAGETQERDLWSAIAERVQGNERPSEWKLETDEEERLEQGEDDAGEVATLIVGRILEDEATVPSRLCRALLSEFHSRHCRWRARSRAAGRPPCKCARSATRRSRDSDMVSLFPEAGGRRRNRSRVMHEGNGDDPGERTNNPPDSNECQIEDAPCFGRSAGLEKTFSFVEETEIVAGEDSDTSPADVNEIDEADETDEGDGVDGVDEAGSGTDVEDQEGDEGDGVRVDHGRESDAPMHSPASAPVPVSQTRHRPSSASAGVRGARADSTVRAGASHMDSWVELEGIGCNGCGGRIVGNHAKGPPTAAPPAADVEDEEGFGESWAAAEAPPCWCREEAALSASPESMYSTSLVARPETSPEEQEQTLGSIQQADAARPGDAAAEEATEEAAEEVTADEPTNAGDDPADGPGYPEPPRSREDEAGVFGDGAGSGEGVEGSEVKCDALRDVHGVLRELTRAVLMSCPALSSSREATMHAVNGIDRRVFAEAYGPVFAHIMAGQARERDCALSRRAREDELARRAEGRSPLAATCHPRALAALRSTCHARTGRDKLLRLVDAVEEISGALPPRATTDTLLWSLCRHLAAATTAPAGVEGAGRGDAAAGGAPAARPYAEISFVEQFMRDESWLMGKEGYVLTTLHAALHVLLDPSTSDDVFADIDPEQSDGSPVS